MSLAPEPGDGRQFMYNLLEQIGVDRAELEEFFENKMDDLRRFQERVDGDQKVFENRQAADEQRLEEKAAMEQAAANRPAEDAANNSIMGMPLQFLSGIAGINLMGQAVEATGGMLSPFMNMLGGQMMVATNTNGDMLAQARGALSLEGPGNDLRLAGPGNMLSFIPGLAPQMGGPTGPAAPGAPSVLADNNPMFSGPRPGGMA